MVPTGDSCAPDHHHRAPLIADSIAPITPDDYPSIVDRYILELHKISQVGGILRGDRTGPEVVAALAGHIAGVVSRAAVPRARTREGRPALAPADRPAEDGSAPCPGRRSFSALRPPGSAGKRLPPA